jgi:hypothetical protein
MPGFKTYPTPIVRRPSLVFAIVLLSLSLLLTIMLLVPSSSPKQIPPEEAEDFVGYLGTVCGHVTSVRQDAKDGIAFLLFGAPERPSFEAPILIRNTNAQGTYEGKKVCVSGTVVDEWGGSEGVPSIRVTDESQVTVE